MFRRWTDAAGEPMPADLTPHMPRAEAMAAVLAHLDEHHGGSGAWLRTNGLTEAELTHLRSRLT
jgi:protein-tyrosine phosphatase